MGYRWHWWMMLLCSLAAACTLKPTTGILVSIKSTVPISSIRLEARNIDYQGVPLTDYNVVKKDLTSTPMVIFVQPNGVIQDTFLLRIRGYDANNQLVGQGAKVLRFSPNKQIEDTVQMVQEFLDDDDDGFVRCNSGASCDCDDASNTVNPFTEEKCDDTIDNNCNGQINEGCPCESDVPCSNLPADLAVRQAGIGACTFGVLRCQNGLLETACTSGMPTEEVDNDFIDNDCDGSVDEGSRCQPGEQRPCHRGFVDDANHPNVDERLGAKQRALGICGQGGAARGVQSCEQDSASRWRWGICKGDVLPQRDNRPQRIGFAELAPSMVPGDLAQCNGLDDDCNGLVDDAPEYDSDRDGYSRCGSNSRNQTYLRSEDMDCNDNDKSVHPGATELCGNNIDEDCRCDHDPENRPITNPNSLIGRPSVQATVLSNREGQQTIVCRNATTLQCFREDRSDANPVGNCGQGDGALYLGVRDNGCYGCDQRFGYSCSPQGRCTTKQEDCRVCTNNQTNNNLLIPRQKCKVIQAGTCSGLVSPVQAASNGADPFGECTGFSCANYYYQQAGACFVRNDVSDAAAVCGNDGNCMSVADLCLSQPGALFGSKPVCRQLSGGCAFNQPPQYNLFTPAGQDPSNECGALVCQDNSNNLGPYYHGIEGKICYFKDNLADNACNGNGACRSKNEVCPGLGRGAIALQVNLCQTLSGCSGTTPPTAFNVPAGQDPAGECNDNFTCSDNSGGSGPYYQLDSFNGRCYFKANVNAACNGNQACQTKGDACLAADASATQVVVRGTCRKFPDGTCSGLTPPGAEILMDEGTDPFNDCPGNQVCRSGLCSN